MKKIALLAFVSVLLFGTILLVAVSVQGYPIGDYPPQWRSKTEYALLWMQPAVSGNDNWATAPYKDGILYAPSRGNDNAYMLHALIARIFKVWRLDFDLLLKIDFYTSRIETDEPYGRELCIDYRRFHHK